MSNELTRLTPVLKSVKFNEETGKATIILGDVTVSFPHLWTPDTGSKFYDPEKPKLTCSFITNEEINKKLGQVIAKVANKVDKKVKSIEDIKENYRKIKRYVTDDDEVQFSITTSNNENFPPKYMNVKGQLVEPSSDDAEDKLYAGRHANVKIEIAVTQNSWGTIVFSNLILIQPSAHGEKLGGGGKPVEEIVEGFGAVDIDDDVDIDTDDEFELEEDDEWDV